MSTQNNHPTKTLGPRTARLFTLLHDEGRTVFGLAKAAEVMGVSHARAASLIHAAAARGLVTHVRRGVYNLIPFELGSTDFHLDDRYLLVRESMGSTPYFLSHASAFDIHQLATQPSFDVYVTSTSRRKNINLGGSLTRFVWAPEARFFGYSNIQVGNNNLSVSDIERTLLDGASLPENCGGIVEVAKAFLAAKSRIDLPRLLGYVGRFDKIAVTRRAGFLLELLGLADSHTLAELANSLPPGYVKLDPAMPSEGKSNPRWGLKLNVSVEQIENAVSH